MLTEKTPAEQIVTQSVSQWDAAASAHVVKIPNQCFSSLFLEQVNWSGGNSLFNMYSMEESCPLQTQKVLCCLFPEKCEIFGGGECKTVSSYMNIY